MEAEANIKKPPLIRHHGDVERPLLEMKVDIDSMIHARCANGIRSQGVVMPSVVMPSVARR